MSAIAVYAMPNAAASLAAPAIGSGEAGPTDTGFEVVLGDVLLHAGTADRNAGGMAPGSSPNAEAYAETAGLRKRADLTGGATDLPSLQAALAALSYLGSPGASLASSSKPQASGTATSRTADKVLSPSAALISAAIQSALSLTSPASLSGAAPVSSAGGAETEALAGQPTSPMNAGAWDVSGATPLKTLLSSDAGLGLQSFEMKTHLAVADAAPARSGATPLRADAAWTLLSKSAVATDETRAPATTTTATSATAALQPPTAQASASVSASVLTVKSPVPTAVAERPMVATPSLPPATSKPTVPAAHAKEQSPSAAVSRSLALAHPGSALERPVVGASTLTQRSSASRTSNETAPALTLDSVVAAAATSAAAAPPSTPNITVSLFDLPAFVADQAMTLAAPSASSGASATTASPKAPQAVKELQILLEPGDLGTLSLKLRLTDGKLSVTIGVANPSTLAAISEERDAIAERLGAGQQKIDEIVIRPQSAATEAGSQNGAEFSSSGSSHESANSSRSDGDAPRRKVSPPIGDASGGLAGGRGALDGYLV